MNHNFTVELRILWHNCDQQFWMPKGRAVVKKTINHCQGCRRWKAKPYQLPQFPAHSKNRVNPSGAFQHIGMDYMSPINAATVNVPILCDNTIQSKLAAKTAETVIKHISRELEDYGSTSAIDWKFTTESTPWKGVLYESLVGLVKESFLVP
ncbi:unnamed protein product [Gongylonema pulchrum]|uniref:Integrase_H2C2 domain-containing protein n=1 Tax=Gongylonema pulchrum TaxID=637853 RepID=A0A183EDF2_9BILA|nr:unnamed protein product [Gongylonema pulchrum]